LFYFIQTNRSSMNENFKDREADHLSFFMLGAIAVQNGYQSMENIDTVDKNTPRYVT